MLQHYLACGNLTPRMADLSLNRTNCRTGSRLALLGGSLHGLLVLPHPGQRTLVGDVSHRPQRPLRTVVAGRLPPTLQLNAELLAQQGHENLRLLLTEPR